jgi:hypothetical protein
MNMIFLKQFPLAKSSDLKFNNDCKIIMIIKRYILCKMQNL